MTLPSQKITMMIEFWKLIRTFEGRLKLNITHTFMSHLSKGSNHVVSVFEILHTSVER